MVRVLSCGRRSWLRRVGVGVLRDGEHGGHWRGWAGERGVYRLVGGWDGMRELGSRIFKSLDGVDESWEISLGQEQLPREEGKASGLNIQESSLRSLGKEACFAPTWRRRGVGTLTPPGRIHCCGHPHPKSRNFVPQITWQGFWDPTWRLGGTAVPLAAILEPGQRYPLRCNDRGRRVQSPASG